MTPPAPSPGCPCTVRPARSGRRPTRDGLPGHGRVAPMRAGWAYPSTSRVAPGDGPAARPAWRRRRSIGPRPLSGARAHAPARRRLEAPVLLPRDGARPARRIRPPGVDRCARPLHAGALAGQPRESRSAPAPRGPGLAGAPARPVALRAGAAGVPVHRGPLDGGAHPRLHRTAVSGPAARLRRLPSPGASHRALRRRRRVDGSAGRGGPRGAARRAPGTVSAFAAVRSARRPWLYCTRGCSVRSGSGSGRCRCRRTARGLRCRC